MEELIQEMIIDDPFEDPTGMEQLMKERGVQYVESDNDDEEQIETPQVGQRRRITASPEYERPPEEVVETRIQADEVDVEGGEADYEKIRQQEEEILKREDRSRAVRSGMEGRCIYCICYLYTSCVHLNQSEFSYGINLNEDGERNYL